MLDHRRIRIVFVLCLVLAPSAARNAVHLVNNIYTDVLIAINEHVAEDLTLIDKIKDMFSEASAHLYTATKERAVFGNITVLIPKSWNDSVEYQRATTEQFDVANFIVDHPNPDYGDNPYTKQPRPCGERGEYAHLTPKWVADREYSETYWGNSAKVIVHEWGHLQWGLFDEYPDIDEQFYFDPSGRVEASRCSLAVTGQSYDLYNQGQICNTDPESGVLPQLGCVYFPHLENNNATGSYMYGNYIKSVTDFCHSDADGDPRSKHNPLALNKQNRLCQHKSAWDVISKSPDFHNANPPRYGMDTTPIFRLVRETEFRTVLIMDLSGSMDNNNRAELQHQAASKYIGYTVPVGSWVGIVRFSTVATELANLTKIDGEQTRQDLIARLPRVPDGGTCIGCGLEVGVQVLESSIFGDAHGGILFLISDGEETHSPKIDDVLPELIEKGVIVDSLALSDNAEQKLVELSNSTNGKSCWYSEGDNSTALHDCFTTSVTERISSGSETPVQLISYKITIPSRESRSGSIFMDSTIGRETYFFFFWDFASHRAINVTLTCPDGTVIDENEPEYDIDPDSRTIIISVSGIAEVGQWMFDIYNPSIQSQVVEISIDSKASNSSTPPIRLTPSLSTDFINEYPAVVVIYADLSWGYNPVLNASVFATVERPSPLSSVNVQLFDSGAGADIGKDDGVYSAYFVDFVQATCGEACRYSIQVKANNLDNSADIQARSRYGVKARNLTLIPEKGEAIPIGYFDRVASAGVIQVSVDFDYVDWNNETADPFPPSRIVDLRVVETSMVNETVTLSWTATGDDLNIGSASRYDLRYATDFTDVFNDFTNCERITDDDLAEGSLLNPAESGSKELVVATMPSSGAGLTYYFSIRAIDDVGNAGEPSNVAQTTIVAAVPIATTAQTRTTPDGRRTTAVSDNGTLRATAAKLTTTTTSTDTTTAGYIEPVSPGMNTWEFIILIIASISAVFLISSIVGLCVYHHKTQKVNKVEPVRTPNPPGMPDVEVAETNLSSF